jgi:DNA phosphorothioation-dependent restriction protein DptG
MSNYESIPSDTRTAIDTLIHNDNSKNAIGRLWKLYLRVNTYDTENAEQDLQNFVNDLYSMPNRTQESMLNAINEKIAHIQQEEGITAFGLKKSKKGKTGKKRKRSTMKTSRKKRKRRN